MSELRYPALYQINTRVWLTELSRTLGKPATLEDIPDAELDRLAELGFDWVWFLSVWQTGPAAQAMIGELERIAGQCDGVRCDMAMLILPDVFERTWGLRADLFWPKATASVRRQHPHFLFMAEVYWDREWTLQQQGFDYAYDKRLYDRLREGQWQVLDCALAWEGNWTWDCFLAFAWQDAGQERLLVTVNYAPNQSQGYVRLPFTDLGTGHWQLKDLLGDAVYEWEGDDLQARGLYLDEPPWQASIFSLPKRD